MTESEFFDHLNRRCAEAYAKAPIRARGWSYSICRTPIARGSGAVIGLNWGGGGPRDSHRYEPQTRMPGPEDFRRELNGAYLRSLMPDLREHLAIDDSSFAVNSLNLCPFRSPSIGDLSDEDWRLGIPIFLEFVHDVKPPWIVITTTSRRDLARVAAADSSFRLDEEVSVPATNGLTYSGYLGSIGSSEFIAVPHPGARIPGDARTAIWRALTARRRGGRA